VDKEAADLINLLKDNDVEYTLYEHEPVYTSEEASRVRNVELKTGVKAMLVREKGGKPNLLLADIAADRRIDFAKLEPLAKVKHFRFATREEVLAATNCEPGSVHPIGRLFRIQTYLDESVFENEFVNFNIGMLTRSVKIRSRDLLKVLQPDLIGDFSKQ
jgi:prolyl-tRNA editing enzyme YbaK/EbsC (Cys-tRNA(Pro) deacylase)